MDMADTFLEVTGAVAERVPWSILTRSETESLRPGVGLKARVTGVSPEGVVSSTNSLLSVHTLDRSSSS
jgi:hypothetical protein